MLASDEQPIDFKKINNYLEEKDMFSKIRQPKKLSFKNAVLLIKKSLTNEK